MDDALALLTKLTLSESVHQQEKTVSQLIKLVCELNEDEDESENDAVQEKIFQHDTTDLLLQLLQSKEAEETYPLLIACAQLVAELAKVESLREPLVNKGFMPPLMHLLPSKNIALATQVCRALGNICYDNALGRMAVDKEKGVQTIVQVLSQQINNKEEGAARLRIIVCGFLLNLTNNCEPLQERAIECDILTPLNECINCHLEDEDLTNMALLTVGSLTELDSGKLSACQCGLLDTFKKLLERDWEERPIDVILDLIASLIETEAAKDKAAENGLCATLANIVNSDTQNVADIKAVSDIFISVLTGDNSMEKIYASGEGALFLQSMNWLSAEKENLKTLGALAIGNFARRDAYCIQLVEKGVVDKLLTILKGTVGLGDSFMLQHAVLSTLRNLAISAANKPQLLAAGVLDVCLSLIHTEHLAVVFKLLGVLRMLIEGQEAAALKLGQERAFLECLTDWCGQAHAGVKGEATRVMASLIKNSRSAMVVQNLIRAEGLGHLVAMATSEHLVMQNEAVMALTIVCSTALAEAAVALKEADLADTVSTLLKDPNLPPEMLCNVLSLLKAILSAENLRDEVANSGVADIVRSLSEGHSDGKVKDLAGSTLSLLDQSISPS
ncbi:rap1 GTPase-GDP dissociation stimulator 1 [Plakobranchus ocellatus]|uniref:Rap1 GTPase-GDP dissociation stimulator 1 n=1 Tax=Plakobranchus ocellatus TaxID=259542 RepID=A0AAV4BSP2_9GAST|nr:rap1 GTPase-GDP dissociation stimulator 1 [Plakobranchus ocellatus]